MNDKKLKVMTIFGTRPEAIKMAPLVLELKSRPEIECMVCVTGQHRQMLDQAMEIFKLRADFDLDIMTPQQTLEDITVHTLTSLSAVLERQTPDIVLVHGDTSTTFVSALSAFYKKIKVGHVEAGLRTYDKYSPFPEEMNRKLTGAIADIHFAPTRANAANLAREGIEKGVYITGNTVIDALKITVKDDYKFKNQALNTVDFGSSRIILATAHRRENYGQPLENIMEAFKLIAENNKDVTIIYPVHLSPYVRQTADRILKGIENVMLIEPLDVEDMHNLMARSYLVMTDSGGLQEEAPALGKPVLVLRRETERPEAVAAGTVKLSGVERDAITADAEMLLHDENAYNKMAHAVNPYGDGFASKRIADALLYEFGIRADKPSDFEAK